MEEPTKLLGRVVNEVGDPIPGANIVAVSGHHFQRQPIDVVLSEGEGLYSEAQFAKTDADGRFEIVDSLEQNEMLSVSVIADGYAPLRMPHEWMPEEPPLDLGDLVVSRGHAISGTVVDASGKPLGDVQVLMALERGVPGCLQSYPGRGIPLTMTDANGRFTAMGLLPGRWFFIFDKSGYRVAEAQGNLFNDPQPAELTITLGRGLSISGCVTNVPDATEKPLMVEARPIRRGVDFCKQFPSRARPRRAIVEADGSFLIEGLNEEEFVPQINPGTIHGFHPECTVDPGTLDVWLVVGHAVKPNQRLIELPEFRACRVEAGTTDVELPWLGRANLSARIVDDAGKPIENFIAKVHFNSAWGPKPDDYEPTIQSGGRVEISDYPFWDTHLQFWHPKRNAWLVIKAPGFEDHSVEILDKLVRGEHNDLGDVVLTKSETNDELCVRVVATNGQPVADARVYQLTEKQAGWYMTLVWDRENLPQLEDWRVADTDANGEVRMPTGNTDLLAVQHPDFGFYTQAIINVDKNEGDCDSSKDDSDDTSEQETPTLNSPIHVTLHKAARLNGTAVDENAQPAALRDVFLERVDESGEQLPGGFRIVERTEIDGTFRFGRLHGRFLVGMRHREEKWRPAGHHLDNERAIVEVADEDVEISLIAWNVHDLTVEIREADRPVIGAKLKLMSEYCCTPDGEYYDTAWQGFTDDRGRYTFRQVAAGDVVLHLKHDDRNMMNRLNFCVGPEMQTVEWLLDNNTISGRLVDLDGKPHAWGRIGIKTDIAGYCQRNNDGITYENGRGGLDWFWSNQAVHETWTDADGNFHLRGLVANIPITLYTRHGEIVDTDLELEPLKPGERRSGVVFEAGYTGQKGWRGSKN